MRERIYLNDDWLFSPVYGSGKYEPVRLPHTVCETPLHYFDESCYQMVSEYKRMIKKQPQWQGKELFLTIDGAAHDAEVFINGSRVGVHHCGYTAFTLNVTNFLTNDENEMKIRLDSRENLNIPPFGNVIDYMTYGGIYREVYLEIREPLHTADLFVKPRRKKEGQYVLELEQEIFGGGAAHSVLTYEIVEKDTNKVVDTWERQLAPQETVISCSRQLEHIKEWDTEHPNLYVLRAGIVTDGKSGDRCEVTFGFREAAFLSDGFYLNGKKVKLRGLNRHQSYPYVGYAMPASMQRRDADILKQELALNAVRTSHYPQSQDFIGRCDEIGLLVFTEIPGWQHIGNEQWKKQAVRNVEDMVQQYRNHPSIVLWGVRINESPDDDAFYSHTNAVARRLDDTRATGGVRCYKRGSLLEDVYTYNDFYHNGKNKGAEPKKAVTSDRSKAYLVSEYNGHMFPTKTFDCEDHRMEHAIRHSTVLDTIGEYEDIAGSFGWCMFDYNTHKDFGSGDRICYHGVMDMFRNPKMAAAVYASQGEEQIVLEVSSSMDIGEHPAGVRSEAYIFTNADSVKMYRNDVFIKEYKNEESPFRHLKHGPVLLDDYIGNQLEEKEGFSKGKAKGVKKVLHAAAKYSLNELPLNVKLTAVKLIALYGMNMEQAYSLYETYIGGWGDTVTVYRFDAIKDGRIVKTVTKAPGKEVHLWSECSTDILTEEKSYDVAAVRIQARDEYGNVLPFYNEPVLFETEGEIELIGPSVASLQGGMGGTYVKTTGKSGSGTLHIGLTDGTVVTKTFRTQCRDRK